jgi:hypothetical protein
VSPAIRRASLAALFSVVNYSAWASSASELLEKGIYAEETEGNLAAAIKIYEQISASADAERATAAQALFRLAMCYQKSGRPDEAKATLDILGKDYPEQRDLLSKIPRSPAPVWPLEPVRWGRSEVLLLKGGDTTNVHRIRAEQRDGKPIYRIESWTHASYGTHDVEAESFQPVRGRAARIWQNDMEYLTAPGRLEITTQEQGEPRKRSLEMSEPRCGRPGLDFYWVRRLPLAEGYRVRIPFVSPFQGQVDDVWLEVVGRETVTVPAGTFETYKVKWTWPRFDTFSWFSSDAHRYPVKQLYASGDPFELLEIRTELPDEDTVSLNDAALDVSLAVPPGWFPVHINPRFARVYAPETRALCSLQRLAPDEQPDKMPPHLAADHVRAERERSNYVVRQGPEPLDLHGLAATRLVAERDGAIEYGLWLVLNRQRVRLWFDVKKERWDEFKPVFDEMIASLKLE